MNVENNKTIHKFSDFAKTTFLTGDKIKIENVVDKEITVINYTCIPSKYGKNNSDVCVKLQFIMDDKEYILFTASAVLLAQLQENANQIPFVTIIKQVNKYYTFS